MESAGVRASAPAHRGEWWRIAVSVKSTESCPVASAAATRFRPSASLLLSREQGEPGEAGGELMDQSKEPVWFRRHQWWIRLALEALAVTGTIVGCVVPLVR